MRAVSCDIIADEIIAGFSVFMGIVENTIHLENDRS